MLRAAMKSSQPAIFAPVPLVARFLVFGLRPGGDPRTALAALDDLPIDDQIIVGLGEPLVRGVGATIPLLRTFPAISGPGCAFPSTQGALWVLLRGDDAGVVLNRARKLAAKLGDGYRVDEDVHAYQHAGGRDLSGYEDGTENPKGDEAIAAAVATGVGPGLDGSSFVASQRWIHDLAGFAKMTTTECDHVIGRRLSDNEEIEDAPTFAHVKRSAQESFDPPAFMLRRSMPWGNLAEHGLQFVAFGATFDAYERVLRRMAGLEDGIVDGLLRFSRAVSGGYYWCPPVKDGRLDLSALRAP